MPNHEMLDKNRVTVKLLVTAKKLGTSPSKLPVKITKSVGIKNASISNDIKQIVAYNIGRLL
jgi:hypothetical protein